MSLKELLDGVNCRLFAGEWDEAEVDDSEGDGVFKCNGDSFNPVLLRGPLPSLVALDLPRPIPVAPDGSADIYTK